MLISNSSPSERERPTDVCTSHVEVFTYTDLELDVLSRENKENATQVNCILYKACGYTIPRPSVCDKE